MSESIEEAKIPPLIATMPKFSNEALETVATRQTTEQEEEQGRERVRGHYDVQYSLEDLIAEETVTEQSVEDFFVPHTSIYGRGLTGVLRLREAKKAKAATVAKKGKKSESPKRAEVIKRMIRETKRKMKRAKEVGDKGGEVRLKSGSKGSKSEKRKKNKE